jgi:hypothetical protein
MSHENDFEALGQEHTACQSYFRFKPILCRCFGPSGQNLQQVTLDQIHFREASCNIQSVCPLVMQFQPPLDVLQASQGIIAEDIAAFFVGANPAQLAPRSACGGVARRRTYRSNEAVYVGAHFWIYHASLGHHPVIHYG